MKRDELVIRGGAYYFKSVNCRSTNREPVPPTFRDVTTGIRICASSEGRQMMSTKPRRKASVMVVLLVAPRGVAGRGAGSRRRA